MKRTTLAALLLTTISFPSLALAEPGQGTNPPSAVPIVPSVPDARDTPWPGGTIAIDIDASDITRGLYRVTQTVPLPAGMRRITLMLPEWLPGNHAPRGPLAELVGVNFSVDGKPAPWKRDPVEVYAFHVDLPAGARALTVRHVHTSPLQPTEGRVTMTPDMLNLQWEKMTLYPAGHYVRRIRVKPTVTLPQGWSTAAALDGVSQQGNRFSWAETDYETLVDSPIFAGANMRRWNLGQKITLNTVADEAALLDLKPENLARLNALADEAVLALGPPAFDRYEFLVALSNKLGDIGLEHLRSSENSLEPKSFTDWKELDWDRNVLAHELVHSWNGKFRRPARLWTPDYRQPMQDNLLWVYEGQTQFWGFILAARSGIQAKETVLGALAVQAGKYAEQAGREWRSVEDTTHDPIFADRKPKPFASLARDEDYYNEGALIWLEADQLIRAETGGQRGLDDFAQRFFGAQAGDGRVKTYEFADVVAALNAVHPHDWASFLQRRIEQPGQPAPLTGIERGGYRLVWKDTPNPFDKARMDHLRSLRLTHSLGFSVSAEGEVVGTAWNSPAFQAGVVTGAKIIGVNGMAFDFDRIKAAIVAAKGTDKPIDLIVKRGDRVFTTSITYGGGLRWPWLEPVDPKVVAPLDVLLAPRAKR